MSGVLSDMCLHTSNRYFDFVYSKSQALEKILLPMMLVKHRYASNFLSLSVLMESFSIHPELFSNETSSELINVARFSA